MDRPREVPEEPSEVIKALVSECQKAVVGKTEIIEDLLVALLAEGHVLLGGVPGVAKTTLGKTFAKSLGLTFNRIQGAPDILPGDIVGTHVFDPGRGTFRLAKGPIFTNIMLIDEINRNTPKTNTAVLEAMQEKQVTIEGETQPLPYPFMIIATQSPIEFHGVFPLPEVLVDRFMFNLNVDYPSPSEEVQISERIYKIEAEQVETVVTAKQISSLIELARDVYIAPHVQSYIVDLVHKTRSREDVSLGASPRASIALSKAARAKALIHGRMYAIPDDVKYLAPRVLRHRLVLSSQATSQEFSTDKLINDILHETAIPRRV